MSPKFPGGNVRSEGANSAASLSMRPVRAVFDTERAPSEAPAHRQVVIHDLDDMNRPSYPKRSWDMTNCLEFKPGADEMGTGLQRAYAATHGLELGATYRVMHAWRMQTRTLVGIETPSMGPALALYQCANGSRHRCELLTFVRWAKGKERVEP